MTLVALAVAGYLIGTISFTRIAARRAVPGQDLAVTEYPVAGTDVSWTYRGVSATSLYHRAGWRWAVPVVVLDGLKAFVPTLAARLVTGGFVAPAVVAAAVIAGHIWPVWWRFVGGRGLTSILGALFAIDVLAIPAMIVAGVVVGLVGFTSTYLAREMGPLLLVPWFWVAAGPGPQLGFAAAVTVMYGIAIGGDLGEERRARRARGITPLPYRARLALAWKEFFGED